MLYYGFIIIHWMPKKIKEVYEGWFKKMPLVLQTVAVAIIVVLMYQAIGADQPPFVYLQF